MPKITINIPTPVEYTDTDTVVSYSEMSTYRQCPLKHHLAYRERWTRPQAEMSALSKGTLWHLVLEHHYLVLQELQDTDTSDTEKLAKAREAITPLLFDQAGKQTEAQELITWMYDGYIEMYGTDPQWRILAVEYKLAEYLPAPDGTKSPFIIKAKLDLIVQDVNTGGVWIVDHKSGANLPKHSDLELDDQFGLYTWLLQIGGLKVMGSIHDAARTTRNLGDMPNPPKGKTPQPLDQRMGRTYLNRTEIETHNIANDAWAVAVNMYPEVYDYDKLPQYSSPDPQQCGWKCDYKEPHLLARQGRDLHEVLVEYEFEQDFTRH